MRQRAINSNCHNMRRNKTNPKIYFCLSLDLHSTIPVIQTEFGKVAGVIHVRPLKPGDTIPALENVVLLSVGNTNETKLTPFMVLGVQHNFPSPNTIIEGHVIHESYFVYLEPMVPVVNESKPKKNRVKSTEKVIDLF